MNREATDVVDAGLPGARRPRVPRWRPGLALAIAIAIAIATSGCRGGSGSAADTDTNASGTSSINGQSGDASGSDARWGNPALAASQVPSVYVEEWRTADNRESCALIAPASLGAGTDATPRAATFAGGWGVAYDQADQGSAFGVAGSGSTTSEEIFSGWSNRRDWADGSFAEYGPEGGEGPNQLAYLRVNGQDCLYNVWSRLGQEHLELLLDQLRRVTVPEG